MRDGLAQSARRKDMESETIDDHHAMLAALAVQAGFLVGAMAAVGLMDWLWVD